MFFFYCGKVILFLLYANLNRSFGFESSGEAQRKAAVMQLCLENTTCYVIHIIHSGIPPLLKSLLEDHSSVKVRS